MRQIFYFNPENDLALAYGGSNYTAPPRAAQLRHDLRLLPCWLAEDNDMILCHDKGDRDWLLQQGIAVDIITPSELRMVDDARFMPWGWSRAMRRTLQRWGAPEHLLPDHKTIDSIHRLSHRRITIAIHRRMQQLTGCTYCPTPVELHDMDEVRQWASSHPGGYLKMPWSGSGQGVYRALNLEDDYLWQWCRGALRRQKSLLCEEALDKVQDFATEWHMRNGEIELVGFSVFDSDSHHQYAGGRVSNRRTLHDCISMSYPQLDTAIEALQATLCETIGSDYNGYLGVDMMLYRDDEGQLALNPCVEVNLRCTMGLITCMLGQRHGLQGTFCITETPDISACIRLTPRGHFNALLITSSSTTRTAVAQASP